MSAFEWFILICVMLVAICAAVMLFAFQTPDINRYEQLDDDNESMDNLITSLMIEGSKEDEKSNSDIAPMRSCYWGDRRQHRRND